MSNSLKPAYLSLLGSGELRERVAAAYEHMAKCDRCGWECGVDRRAGVLGVCKTGEHARVSSYGPHLGEEDPLRGWRGSGTIFFARCNLRCQFCQNLCEPSPGRRLVSWGPIADRLDRYIGRTSCNQLA